MRDAFPLTKETFEQRRAHVEPHDHAVHVFEREDDMLAPLGTFLREGLARKETCVFVHSFPEEAAAWCFLLRARPEADALRKDQLVVVSLYKDAFQGLSPSIDYEHVDSVVGGLVAAAKEGRRAGVRIFVDASRRYFSEGRVEEWFSFESWLGRRLQANVGLVCAYQASDVMRPDILPQVLRTHSYRFDAA